MSNLLSLTEAREKLSINGMAAITRTFSMTVAKRRIDDAVLL